jgi:hypothetical protein
MKLLACGLLSLALHVASVCAEPPPSPPPPRDTAPTAVELADPTLAATPEKRQQLHYLVRCALPPHILLYTPQGADRFTFPGQLGLAPEWLRRPLTSTEERWVSACLFALTNPGGKQVEVSLHADPAPVPGLQLTADDQQHFPLFEGGFFGNLFRPHPVAYVCQGTRTPAEDHDPIFQDRVCTRSTGEHTPDGKPFTSCQFILTGLCTDPASFTVDGEHYSEVIFVHLKSGLPEK